MDSCRKFQNQSVFTEISDGKILEKKKKLLVMVNPNKVWQQDLSINYDVMVF